MIERVENRNDDCHCDEQNEEGGSFPKVSL